MDINIIDPDRQSILSMERGLPHECIPPTLRKPKRVPTLLASTPSPTPRLQVNQTITAGRGRKASTSPRAALPSSRAPARPASLFDEFCHMIDVHVREDIHIVLMALTWLKYRIRARLHRIWDRHSAWVDPTKMRVNGRWVQRSEAEAMIRKGEGRA